MIIILYITSFPLETYPSKSCQFAIQYSDTDTAVSEVLVTTNKNGSQITCYAANGDWLFISYSI